MRQILQQAFGAPATQVVRGSEGDILLFSMRSVSPLVGYCLQYEFEDVIAATTGADRVEPTRLALVEAERRIYKALFAISSAPAFSLRATPRIRGLRLVRDYELFLPIFNNAYEVFAVNAVPGWRERCRHAACVISEAVESDLPDYLLKSLANFDRIYLCSNPVAAVERIIGRPCSYLPLGVDALSFCPFPEPPPRSVDVLGIGRRSVVTHAALMELARARGLFYYYDTVRMSGGVTDAAKQITFSVIDPAEHRFKLASLLKRSRYYLASRARANQFSADYDEISARFFEGAAAGAIMIGEAPRTGRFPSLFDWPDAVVQAPFDDPAIGDVIARLEGDPDRSIRIRRDNVVNALLRHDWAYRLRTILDDAGMPPPPALLAREARLRELADVARSAPIAP